MASAGETPSAAAADEMLSAAAAAGETPSAAAAAEEMLNAAAGAGETLSAAAADEMLSAAAAAGERFAVPGASSKPQRRVAVLICMDARIDPLPLLGLARGDAHVIRNAGGLVTDDAIRSISVSQRLLGTDEVVVVMHEGCGLNGADDDAFARQLADDGARPRWRLGGFADLEQALAASLARLRESPELPHRERIRGLIFDPQSGALREPAASAG